LKFRRVKRKRGQREVTRGRGKKEGKSAIHCENILSLSISLSSGEKRRGKNMKRGGKEERKREEKRSSQ